jgi:hypothetical protein
MQLNLLTKIRNITLWCIVISSEIQTLSEFNVFEVVVKANKKNTCKK